MTNAVALGIDRYSRGWVGVVLRPSSRPAVVADSALEALIARVPDADCIGIDMPIGLPPSSAKPTCSPVGMSGAGGAASS